MEACWTAGQQVEKSVLHQGMIHNKIHLISPGCPQPSIAFLTMQNHGLKHHSFHLLPPLCPPGVPLGAADPQALRGADAAARAPPRRARTAHVRHDAAAQVPRRRVCRHGDSRAPHEGPREPHRSHTGKSQRLLMID